MCPTPPLLNHTQSTLPASPNSTQKNNNNKIQSCFAAATEHRIQPIIHQAAEATHREKNISHN